MSDDPDRAFMDEVIHSDEVVHPDAFQIAMPANFLTEADDCQCECECHNADATDADANDSDDCSIESLDLIHNQTIDEFSELVDQLSTIAVKLTCHEIAMTKEALEKFNTILEARTIRATFCRVSLGLHTSLSDLDTYIMKKNDFLRMTAAERIAVRPLFHRAGYEVPSADPPVLRNGLPRAISMPENLSDAEDVKAVSSLCLEFPAVVYEFED